MGSDEKAPHETYVQIAGNGQRLSARRLREAIDGSGTLHKALLHYAHKFMTQTAETATDTPVIPSRPMIPISIACSPLATTDIIPLSGK